MAIGCDARGVVRWAARLACVLLLGLCACCAAAADGADARRFRFSGYVSADVDSAYISTSGGLSDTKPVAIQTIGFRQNLGDFGFLDGYVWSISALHDKQRERHGQLFYWTDGAVHYGYDLPLGEGLSLQTKAGPYCGIPVDYEREHNPSLGFIVAQRFDNPYVTPYWSGLWLQEPNRKGRVKAGLTRGFRLRDDLVLTAYFQSTWMDHRRYRARYGAEIEERNFMGGAVAFILFGLQLDWQVAPNLRFYVAAAQYDVVNGQARDAIKRSNRYYDKCDWPLFKAGVRLTF